VTVDDNGQQPDQPEPDQPPDGEPSDPDREGELRREVVRHRREARAAQQATDELRAELERIRVENESAQERAIREAVEAAEQRLTAEFATERLHNRLRVRAAGRLRDPEDAVLHLGAQLAPDADDAAVDEAIEQLIKDRDYLANPATLIAPIPADGLVSQGARSGVPARAVRETSPDDWIRARARRQR
jgi:hypothetical protein